MALIILGTSAMGALAMALAVYALTGSLLLSILAYGVFGSILLFAVIFAALLKEQAELSEVSDPLLFPAE
ncbi:MAG: hypothetical protein KJO42_03125 [Silicimonas sp.]|nr:hypothetical protein [Silicimonas sp.]NNF91855.1 hypothetical protein [Boseongicola sp.]NND18807.1 hypothetical protein [Silicimonas sp.]NND22164.1 hypothetical protein [Silicimonas sp.]NND40712.1 hypothetical protein [Silicimonas sp.]